MLPADIKSQPIIHHLLMITKKYLSVFADFTTEIPLERYHYALIYIHENNETLTQKDLAAYFNVDKSFMVNMIDYLSQNDFVYRETSSEDRRKHLIKLTKKALAYLPEITEAIQNANKLALANFSTPDQIKFLELIKQMELNLNVTNNHSITIDYKKSKI